MQNSAVNIVDVPDISVIITTFRRPVPLCESIRSVLSQADVTTEILVVDDSPEGSARAVVDDCGHPSVRYVQMPAPTGGKPALVRNFGIAQTSGRFVHFLDDDDTVAEGTYAAVVAALNAQPSEGVAFGRIEPFGRNRDKVRHEKGYFETCARRALRFSSLPNRRRLTAGAMMFLGTLLVCSAGLIRRECLAQTDGFDELCTPIEDIDFYTRAIRRFGYVFVDRVVMNYRTGEPSLTNDLGADAPLGPSFDRMHNRYSTEFSAAELFVLKVLMRTVFRGF